MVASSLIWNERQQQSFKKARKVNPKVTEGDWFKLSLDRIRRKARATPTNLSITAEEQDVLVTAGRLLICLHEDRIRSSVSRD